MKKTGSAPRDVPGGASKGALFVVATPIGNLEDISRRAIKVLAEVDLILSEDTRHTRKLLSHFGIATRLRSYHEHNERGLSGPLADRIEAGERMALVSDAGTPLLHDPGFALVAELHRRALAVIPVPGASALTGALSICAIPGPRFCFEGFLPARAGARRTALQGLAGERRLMVFYETPHRLAATLADMAAVFGAERQAMVARELTKIHEHIHHAALSELLEQLQAAHLTAKGEFVVAVAGSPVLAPEEESLLSLLLPLLEVLPVKSAVAVAAKQTGANRNRLYKLAVSVRQSAVL